MWEDISKVRRNVKRWISLWERKQECAKWGAQGKRFIARWRFKAFFSAARRFGEEFETQLRSVSGSWKRWGELVGGCDFVEVIQPAGHPTQVARFPSPSFLYKMGCAISPGRLEGDRSPDFHSELLKGTDSYNGWSHASIELQCQCSTESWMGSHPHWAMAGNDGDDEVHVSWQLR